MTKFIRIKRKKLGGSARIEGVRFKFHKKKATGKVQLTLSMGKKIQEHLKIVHKDRIALGYGEDNPYEMQLLKATPQDIDSFLVSNPSGCALAVAFPWDVSIVPDEILAQRSQDAAYELQDGCVILKLEFRYDEKIH